MNLTASPANKPFCDESYFYHTDEGVYAGACWKDETGWHAFCCISEAKYGHLGDAGSRQEAEMLLKARVMTEDS